VIFSETVVGVLAVVEQALGKQVSVGNTFMVFAMTNDPLVAFAAVHVTLVSV
jgi:hypothetical protein